MDELAGKAGTAAVESPLVVRMVTHSHTLRDISASSSGIVHVGKASA
jgi:hypothetical protein